MKKFKAFTLIELLVVIVIFGIIMSALMNFFKPLRQTYLDSTLYEEQRTAQNGIIEYLCESTRYAEKMCIYDAGAKGSLSTVSDPASAVANYCDENTITDPKDKNNIRIIVINRADCYTETGDYVGKAGTGMNGYSGRIITNYLADDKTTATCDSFKDYGERTKSNAGTSYMALGGGYYGASDYAIYIDYEKTYPEITDDNGNKVRKYAGGITFTVRNSLANNGNIVKNGASYGGSTVSVEEGGGVEVVTSQGNRTLNLLSNVNYYTNEANTSAGSVSSTGNITRGTTNTYIVFQVPTEDQR